MPGPAASVLLPMPVTQAVVEMVREEIRGVAEVVEGDDFWVDGQPSSVAFHPDYPGELEDLAEEGLPLVLEWTPLGVVTVLAQCSGTLNHRILGGLCLRLSRRFRSIVDLGGAIPIGPVLPEASKSSPVRVAMLGGVLLAASYLRADGSFGTSHYCDAGFLDAWLRHPRFTMVK